MNREDILNEFNKLADKNWAQDKNHTSIINTKNIILGVRTPDMRLIARKIAKVDLQDTFLALKDEYFEENLLYGFLLGRINDIDMTYKMLISFLSRVDNWAVCDQTCASLKVFVKDKQNKYFEKFLKLSSDKKEFYARVGIIMLMTYYLKPECVAKIFDCISNLNCHEYYVDMAAAWLVSVAIVKFPDETIELIKTQKLQKRVQNKAICKCRDSFRINNAVKEQLKEYRIV